MYFFFFSEVFLFIEGTVFSYVCLLQGYVWECLELEKLNPQGLELEVVVSHLMWVPGTKLWPSRRALQALNH